MLDRIVVTNLVDLALHTVAKSQRLSATSPPTSMTQFLLPNEACAHEGEEGERGHETKSNARGVSVAFSHQISGMRIESFNVVKTLSNMIQYFIDVLRVAEGGSKARAERLLNNRRR